MRKNEFWMHIIVLITGGLLYSIVSFAYLHDTFQSKDVTQMIIQRLDRIEKKLDKLRE